MRYEVCGLTDLTLFIILVLENFCEIQLALETKGRP